ncbi:LpqN/LpqT family lipoprotein [Mycolicibacter heraklionensis]|uniref:LpqN/LpqT family lipoprotein n=1 Tax=Mycolicibacter heraklionensis TaxID=512402 RepID=UPI002AB0BCD6|nr:LpqN/LpqT family lipoprotein [Mycolicibacter heraklionensis]
MESQASGSQGPSSEELPEQPRSEAATQPARRSLSAVLVAVAVAMAIALTSAALVAAVLIVIRRSHEPAVEASDSSLSSKCAPSPVPLAHLDHRAADEPRLALPQPNGWVFDAAGPPRPPIVRAVMAGRELGAYGFVPNTVVTLENLTDKVELRTPQDALEWESAGITGIVDQSRGVICGYPAVIIAYNADDEGPGGMALRRREVTSLIVAGQDSGNRLWAATVTIQSRDPSNPAYTIAKQAILTGFQFAFAGD